MENLTHSESIGEIMRALFLFEVKSPKIIKTRDNTFLKSKYADLSDVKEAIREPLLECGLHVFQTPLNEHELLTRITHVESGEYIQSTFKMTPNKSDPQTAGAVITYQRRYAMVAMLGLVTDDDDDGNSSSKKLDSATDEKKIQDCKTVEELKKLWEENPEWENNNEYRKRIIAKRNELNAV